MAIQSAVGYSEDIEESYKAGIEIGEMILEKTDLQKNSVGILFCNIEFDFPELLRGIREKLPIPLIGCTTSGEANDQGFFDESASLMVITGDEFNIGLGIGQNLSQNPEDAVRNACLSAKTMLGEGKSRLALTFPDHGSNSSTVFGEHILNLIEAHIEKDLPVVGGLAGDNYQFKQTFQFLNGEVYTDSIPLLLFSGNIEPLVVTRSGWIPMGNKAKATKVDGNILYEINHEPAIDYLKKYIPGVDDPYLMAACPLAVWNETEDAELRGEFVVRSTFRYNKENGAVIYEGEVPENATIQLARGTRDDILAGVKDAITTLAEKAANRKLHALFCFSCAGRKLILGLQTKNEIKLILDGLSTECAVNGFYTDGEIGPIDSSVEHLKKNRFHSTTLVLCGI